ncbi:uncharacterized protein METZ01_LOCUS216382 [marine metagenome]|uniref:Uncharacterized protein n=1 Tax=marine metagenome TaxID=408172 RepID=A0A382FKD0_9ZZZZ
MDRIIRTTSGLIVGLIVGGIVIGLIKAAQWLMGR